MKIILKKFKKVSFLMLIIVSIMFVDFNVLAQTNNNTSTEKINTFLQENNLELFNSLDVRILNDSGEEQPFYSSDTHLLIALDWQVDTSYINSGDYYEIAFPKELEITSVEGEHYTLENNKIKINFGEEVHDTPEILDTLYLRTNIKEDVCGDTTNCILNFSEISPIFSDYKVPFQEVKFTNFSNGLSLNTRNSGAVSRFQLYGDKTTYLTGEEVTRYVGFSMSEDSGAVANATLEIRVPLDYIDYNSIEGSDIQNQVSKVKSREGNYGVIRYQLNQIASGVSIDFPVKFTSLSNGRVPHDTIVEVEAKLIDANDQVMSEVVDAVTYEIILPTITKYAPSSSSSVTSSDINNPIRPGGLEDPNNPGYFSTDLDDLVSVDFSYQTSFHRSGTRLGYREYSHIVVQDFLPEEAVFVAEDNPGWVYDPVTHIATYNNAKPFRQGTGGTNILRNDNNSALVLKLKFPGAIVEDGVYTNNVTTTFIPYNQVENEIAPVASDDIDFTLRVSKYPTGVYLSKMIISMEQTIGSSFYDTQEFRNHTLNWRVSVRSNADIKESPNSNLIDLEVRDYGLSPELKYLGLTFLDQSEVFGNVDVIVKYSDGSTRIIADINPNEDKSYYFENQDEVIDFSVKFKTGTYIGVGGYIVFNVETELRDKNVSTIAPNKISKTMENSAVIDNARYSHNLNTKISTTSDTETMIWQKLPTPELRLQKSASPYGKTIFLVGDEIEYSLELGGLGLNNTKTIVEDAKVVDILPLGFNYIPNTAKIDYKRTTAIANNLPGGEFYLFDEELSDIKGGNVEPQLVYNYKDTGQTALIWDLGDIHASYYEGYIVPMPDMHVESGLVITYSSVITLQADTGINTNNAYFAWSNVDEIIAAKNQGKSTNSTTRKIFGPSFKAEDIYDLNNNNSTEDYITRSEYEVGYIPPLELLIKTEVKGNLDSNYLLSPANGTSELDSIVEYNFELYNNSIVDIDSLYILSLLPTVGDLTVSENLLLDPVSRVERASTFPITLDGPIHIPEGFKVWYTTDTPTADMKDFYNNASWSNSLTDYSKATAFKMEMLSDSILLTSQRQSFSATFRTPADNNLDENTDMAVNSFAVALNSNLDFFESNFSTVKIVKYKVKGHIFDDFNENGILDQTDAGFDNYLVQLVDINDNVVLDSEGNPYQSITDENGYYEMPVYNSGTYRIKVLTPEGYNIVTAGTTEQNSHITDGVTDTFNLDTDNPEVVKNAGYYKSTSSIAVYKELQNHQGTIINSDLEFNFTIEVNEIPFSGNGVSYPKDDKTNTTAVTINEGSFTIPANHVVEIEGITKNATYTIKEVATEGYVVTPTSGEITGILEESLVELTFINVKELVLTEYTVTKVWEGGPSTKPTISIQLFQDGIAYGEAIELTSGTTTYTWEGLPETKDSGEAYVYTVDEVSVLTDYIKTVDGGTITNTYIDRNGTLIVHHVDEEGNPLYDSRTTLAQIGDPYETVHKDIDGYELIEVIGNKEGTIVKGETEVIYVYKKKAPYTGIASNSVINAAVLLSALGVLVVLHKKRE